MIYHQLFDRHAPDVMVRAGIIGTGHYATATVTQSVDMPRLEVQVVSDIDLASCRLAFTRAGFSDDDIVECDSRSAALQAIERGQRVILSDPLLMMDLPLDVIAEATGSAEAGAVHGSEAIRNGKHVAMINKEADVTVGPVLKHHADRAGVVYTAVDGDQHGLLMGLVSWARELGLEVLCGGKFRDTGLIFDEATGTLFDSGSSLPLPEKDLHLFQPISPGQVSRVASGRLAAMGKLGEIAHHDYEELTIAANGTGLAPDVERLHHPALRMVEIPQVLCPVEDGGILADRGAIEMVSNLRHADEAGGGGGVFIVVSAVSAYSRYILSFKGCLSNSQDSAALVYRPQHLCGVETPISILCAALLGLPTGATEYLPRFDVMARATEDKKAGEALDYEDVEISIRPAGAVDGGAPLSLYMALWNELAGDVPAGKAISKADVVPPKDSLLWRLRREQDDLFLG